MEHKLIVQPKGFLRKGGELLVRNVFEIYAGEVMADI